MGAKRHLVLCTGALFHIMWPMRCWPPKLCESKNDAPTFLLFHQNFFFFFCPVWAFAEARLLPSCPFQPIVSFLQHPDHVKMWYLLPRSFKPASTKHKNGMFKTMPASTQNDAQGLRWALSSSDAHSRASVGVLYKYAHTQDVHVSEVRKLGHHLWLFCFFLDFN